MSDGISAYWRIFSGSSQIRMAYSWPIGWMLPTPLTRLIWSSMRASMKLATSKLSMLPSSLVNDSTSKIEPLDLVMVRPFCCTACGNVAMAACSWFCTCTCAVSGLVPVANTRLTCAEPSEALVEVMYIRWSRLCWDCSMTWVTAFSTVCDEAPV